MTTNETRLRNAQYRAYDTTTEWSGPVRKTIVDAQRDADKHDEGCASQGGYGSAIVVQRDGGRLADLDGEPVWPPHGMTCGAARWR